MRRRAADPGQGSLPFTAAAYRIDGQAVDGRTFYAAACDPARAVIVEACAGAGKTWMLISRIVRALLAGTPPQHILAITFTRKAAGEMRQRLDEWLAHFATADTATREAALRERGLDAAAARALAPALGALHGSLLDAGRAVEIRTFHAWFAQLLRAAPIELLDSVGLDPGRELIEDIEELAPQLYRRFHAALLADAGLEDDYLALVHGHGRTQLRKWLDAAWRRRVEIELADRAGTLQPSVEPASADGADPARQLSALRPLLRELAHDLGASRKSRSRQAADALLAALAQDDDRAAFDGARSALLNDDGELRAHVDAPAVHEAVAALDALQAVVHQHDASVSHARMVRLARRLLVEWAALKRKRGLADMADLEQVALALLRDAALAGWVQQRLDARVRHLLIDEFQDTSPLQWQALEAWLGAYAGAGGGAAAPVLVIVGDPKQSIYRFRRAEPRVFAAARMFVREALGGTLLECDHTRRNAPAVLAAVNAVFGAAEAQGRFDGFREHTTDVAGDPAAPLAQALPALLRPPRDSTSAPDETAPRVWRDSLTTPRLEPDEPWRRHEARQVARAIAALLAGAGVALGDIMVLARQREPLRHLAIELQALALPYAAAEQVLLFEMPEVRDLIALLDVLASPGHDLSLAQALKSALFGAGDDDLLRLSRSAAAGHGGRWWPALLADTSAALQPARERLVQWSADAGRLPPHDLLDRVLHDTDLVARVAARVPAARRASALAAIDALLALALELDGARYPTIYGFVRALKRRALKVALTRPADAVQLLTVHAAKGLEAPVVFLMDTDAETRNPETMTLLVDWPVEAAAPRRCAFVAAESRCAPSLRTLLQAETAARERESLNALYVAMTRARSRLVVSRTDPSRPTPQSWWRLLAPHVSPWMPPDAAGVPGLAGRIDLAELPAWPGVAADAAPAAPSHDDPAARLGSALHRVLEWASGPMRGAAPLGALCDAASASWRLDPGAATALQRHAEAILASPACRRFYDAAACRWAGNEVALPGRAGETLRVDRLVAFDDDGGDGASRWWVIDLKLHPAPQIRPEYLDQLRGYRDALRALQPGDAVHCAFITGDGRLIEPDLPP